MAQRKGFGQFVREAPGLLGQHGQTQQAGSACQRGGGDEP